MTKNKGPAEGNKKKGVLGGKPLIGPLIGQKGTTQRGKARAIETSGIKGLDAEKLLISPSATLADARGGKPMSQLVRFPHVLLLVLSAPVQGSAKVLFLDCVIPPPCRLCPQGKFHATSETNFCRTLYVIKNGDLVSAGLCRADCLESPTGQTHQH